MAALSAREAAYQKLWERIMTMELEPGEVLNDRLLAEEMRMSRTPVREALIMLSTAYLVVVKPQSGTHVALIDRERMEMEQYARLLMEKDMALRAAPRMTPERKAAYLENIEACRECEAKLPAGRERAAQLLRLDNQFHRLAFEANGMGRQYDYMTATFQSLERLRMFSLMSGENGELLEEHTRIAEAMFAADLPRLERELEKHLQRCLRTAEAAQALHPEYFTDGGEE